MCNAIRYKHTYILMNSCMLSMETCTANSRYPDIQMHNHTTAHYNTGH